MIPERIIGACFWPYYIVIRCVYAVGMELVDIYEETRK